MPSPAERKPSTAKSRPREKRLDDVFGDVLPTTTSDERDHEPPRADRDEWYQENRPPHHG